MPNRTFQVIESRRRAELHNLIVACHQELRTAIDATIADLEGIA